MPQNIPPLYQKQRRPNKARRTSELQAGHMQGWVGIDESVYNSDDNETSERQSCCNSVQKIGQAPLITMSVLIGIVFNIGALLFQCILSAFFIFLSLKGLETDPKVIKHYRKTYTQDLGLSNSTNKLMLGFITKLVLIIISDLRININSRTISQNALDISGFLCLS